MPEQKITAYKDAGDCLHRGDIIGVRYDHYARTTVNNIIIGYQRNTELLPYPMCEISHVIVVSGGAAWEGYEMQPPHGSKVDIRSYERCQLWVMRYDGWRDDEQRYSFVDRAAYLANVRYSWSGCIHLATSIFPQLPGGRFCSEQTEQAAEDAGVNGCRGFVTDYPAERCSPARICTSPFLHVSACIWMPSKS